MREKFKYAGQKVKIKQGVGISSFGQDMSGQDFVKRALKDKLNFLQDNCYRYKLQAKAWGIEL